MSQTAGVRTGEAGQGVEAGARPRSRLRASWFWAALAVVAVALALGVSIESTLLGVSDGLPVAILSQERDISVALGDIADLENAIEDARNGASSKALPDVWQQLNIAKTQLERLRSSYNFDNLVGAAAVYAIAHPALLDVETWLTNGLYGYPPTAPLVLDLARRRLIDVYAGVRAQIEQSQRHAIGLLDAQARKLLHLREFAAATLALLVVVALAAIWLTVRQRRLRDEISAARALLADGVESIADGLVLFDAVGRVAVANRRYRDLHRGEAPRAALMQAPPGTESLTYEASPPGGRWYRVSERRTSDGGIVSVSTDITELKRREQDLAQQSTLLRVTFDSMSQGIAAFDADSRLLAHNRRVVELLRLPGRLLTPTTMLGDWLDHLREARARFLAAAGASDAIGTEAEMPSRRPQSGEIVLVDGTVIEVQTQPLATGGFTLTYTDVTERRHAEAALRAAKEAAELSNRTKSEFLANMSHELRTPLNAILGFSEILREQMFGVLGDARYVEYAQDIHVSGAHLLSLINDLLDFSKIEAGHFALNERPVLIPAAIDGAVRLVRERALRGGLKLEVAVDPETPAIQADERALKQVLLNLLSNAVKFTKRDGRVMVTAGLRPDGSLAIAVADTGIGIAPADIATALAPFGQIESSLSRRYDGTGLGLPLAKSLVELHGGTLELASEVGVGTTATVLLPADRVILGVVV